jgi:hypothetical protein
VCKLSNFAQTVAPSLVTLLFDMEVGERPLLRQRLYGGAHHGRPAKISNDAASSTFGKIAQPRQVGTDARPT